MKSKLVVVDARISQRIIENLAHYANDIFLFSSKNITYESISCHPDIFIYQYNNEIIIAPNTPQSLKTSFIKNDIPFTEGTSSIGSELNNSCYYNCVATPTLFLHRKEYTDPLLLAHNQTKQFIALPQSYTRCSMLHLGNNHFITSDAGIHHTLQQQHLDSFLFSPNEIRIVNHQYGFLGGTCGIFDQKVFFLGNPLAHKEGKKLVNYIETNDLECISLNNDLLYDGGGIFFF